MSDDKQIVEIYVFWMDYFLKFKVKKITNLNDSCLTKKLIEILRGRYKIYSLNLSAICLNFTCDVRTFGTISFFFILRCDILCILMQVRNIMRKKKL
jgi:hypothetical protein